MHVLKCRKVDTWVKGSWVVLGQGYLSTLEFAYPFRVSSPAFPLNEMKERRVTLWAHFYSKPFAIT